MLPRMTPMIGFTISGEMTMMTEWKTLSSGDFEVDIIDDDGQKKYRSVAIWALQAVQLLDGSHSDGHVTGYLMVESGKIQFNTIGSKVEMDKKFGTRLTMGDIETCKKLLAAIKETTEQLDGMELHIPKPDIPEEKTKLGFDLRRKDER